jgi:hypothetical protein
MPPAPPAPYKAYLAAFFFAASFLAVTAGVTLLAGLDFPKDPLKIFPFFVFLSPLPIMTVFLKLCTKIKKQGTSVSCFFLQKAQITI